MISQLCMCVSAYDILIKSSINMKAFVDTFSSNECILPKVLKPFTVKGCDCV